MKLYLSMAITKALKSVLSDSLVEEPFFAFSGLA
jgi:hypothetical protein